MTAADYTDALTLQAWLRLDDNADRVGLAQCVSDASRIIDRLCGYPDGWFSPQTLTRDYDVPVIGWSGPYDDYRAGYYGPTLAIDPLLSVTSLTADEDGDGTYERTWTASTDYLLGPTSGPPYTFVLTNAITGSLTLPAGPRRVRIVGSWGAASAIPGPIRRLALELAARKFKRADAPFGVMGSAETGVVRVGNDEEYARKVLMAEGYLAGGRLVIA